MEAEGSPGRKGSAATRMTKRKYDRAVQSAALPWRISEAGRREVLLLTSRETGRWVIPKGWPMKGRNAAQVASTEALEEAGIEGTIVGKRPIGAFHYEKRLPDGAVICRVRVFLFRVERELDSWRERDQRERRWFDAQEAATMVEEGGLAEIINNFATQRMRYAPLPRRHALSGTASITRAIV
jgi:ADP-ribose pyrophosphatase YjhB (NUDIX family)